MNVAALMMNAISTPKAAAAAAVSSGPVGRGGQGCDAAEVCECGFGTKPVGVVASGDEKLAGNVETDTVERDEVRGGVGDEGAELCVVLNACLIRPGG